ncbi:MAG: Gfo/Idh/MocA family oxidoreductase [Promethearchaeota archaeon]|nr:MAG: Gfo/Idh/MocA family oxidoreductase [Candidatus Lokiarchaeota archaeon]
MKKLKVGIIGAGFVADHHAYGYSLLPNVEIIGISALHEKNPNRIRKKLGLECNWYKDYQDLLKQECDVISICLPNYLHKQATIDALNSGSHVLIEKPLARRVEEGIEMLDAEKSSNRRIFYCENNIYAPCFRKAKEVIKEGGIGEIYMANGREQHSGPHSSWFYKKDKAGGGALLDLGIHDIACLIWYLDCKVEKVFCQTNTIVPERELYGKCEVEDNAVGILYFENGAHVVIEESWTKPGGYDMRFELFGIEGQISVSPTFNNQIRVYSEEGYGYAVEKASSTKGWTFPVPNESWTFGYPQEIQHFVDAILENKKIYTDGEFGLKTLKVAETMYKSAKTNKKEEIDYL